MRTLLHAAILAVSMAGGPLLAQQPVPAPQPGPQPRQPGPGPERGPQGGRTERRGPDGFRMMIYSPTALLEHREALSLTPEQVTKLSTLETDLKTARDKAQADAKPHRDELDKLWQQSAPDITQIRSHTQAMMQAEQAVRLTAVTSTASAKAILTPEQRGRVQGWADARMAERGRGHGMRFRRPGGGDGPENNMPRGERRPGGFGMQRRSGGEL